MRSIFDITLNIVVPIILLIVAGRYVFRTGNFIKGAVMTWALLAGYEWLSFFGGFIAHLFAPTYENYFDDGPGAFVMTIFAGPIYGLAVSLIAILIRYLVRWIKKIRNDEQSLDTRM